MTNRNEGDPLLDTIIHTEYGLFTIVWNDEGVVGNDPKFFGQSNGILGTANPEGLLVVFGQTTGAVQIKVTILTSNPGEVGMEQEWEDVVEASTEIPLGATIFWSSGLDRDVGQFQIQPGTYRIRLSERGRDIAHTWDLADDDAVVDQVLMQWWPSPLSPDAVLRVGSESARQAHATMPKAEGPFG